VGHAAGSFPGGGRQQRCPGTDGAGGLTATAASSSQINLSWTASTDNVGVTGYRVERSTGAGSTTFAQIAVATGTTYTDTGLSVGTVYNYRVRAADAGGNVSTYSNTATATSLSSPAPVITSAITVNGTVGTVFPYTITASNSPASFNAVGLPAGLAVNTTTGVISGTPSAAGTSSVTISATNAVGTGSATLTLTIVPASADTTAPSAPANLRATSRSGSVALSWTASADNVGVTGYRIERKSSSGSFSQIGTATGTTFGDAGVRSRTSYSYRVRATDAAGNLSAYSNVASVTTR